MRGRYLLVLLVLLLPTQSGLLTLPSGPEVQTSSSFGLLGEEEVLLSEVSPARPSEHIVLENRGGPVDLRGWSLQDGEGSVLLNLSLQRGERVGLAADAEVFALLHPEVRCVGLGTASATLSGRFALADAGDCVRLVDPQGRCRDSLFYGKVSDPLDGWYGSPVMSVTKGHAAVRAGGDSDTAADWSVEPPGRSDLPTSEHRVSVEPFTAPEEAEDRLLREINLAAISLRVAVYEISDPTVVSALAQRSRQGVEVKVLAEGQPVAGLSDDCAAALASLAAAGCEVRVLASADGYKRYDYLHCKYLVADGRRTLVMSENWAGGLDENRGWGAVCEGRELAVRLTEMFDRDFGGPLDTREVEAGDLPSGTVPAPVELPYRRHLAEVAPIIAPDNAEEQYRELLRSAQDRVLVQLLYVQEDWVGRESLLSELVEAAARGAQVRVLLDAAWSADGNRKVARYLNEVGERGGWDLQAKLISPYHGLGIVHNKGLVADDTVVVSSLNWCDNALEDNREVGLAIRSAEVSGFFAAVFWSDWSDDPHPPVLVLPWRSCVVQEGVPVLIDASNATDASGIQRIEFDLDGDGTVEWTGPSWTVTLPPGRHLVAVTAYDRFNNSATVTCEVEVTAAPSAGGPPLVLFAAIPLLLLPLLKRIMPKRNH